MTSDDQHAADVSAIDTIAQHVPQPDGHGGKALQRPAHLNIARPYAVVAALDAEHRVEPGTRLRHVSGDLCELVEILPRRVGQPDVVRVVAYVESDTAAPTVATTPTAVHADRVGLRIVWPDDQPAPAPVDQPGDVLLVRTVDGIGYRRDLIAVRTDDDAGQEWIVPGAMGVDGYPREALDGVTPARVVPAAVLEDIAQHAHTIEHAELGMPDPEETIVRARILAGKITDAVDKILTGGA